MAVGKPRPVNRPGSSAAGNGQGTNSAAVPTGESAFGRAEKTARLRGQLGGQGRMSRPGTPNRPAVWRAGNEHESPARRGRTPAAAPDVRAGSVSAAEPACPARRAAGDAEPADGERAARKWRGKEPRRSAAGPFHDPEGGYAAEDPVCRRFACAITRRSQGASTDQRAGFGAPFALSDDSKRLIPKKMIGYCPRVRLRAIFRRKLIADKVDQIFRPSFFLW